MKDRIRLAALPFVTLAPLLWAGNFVVGRAMHETVDPFTLNYSRWVIAAAVLLPVLIKAHRDVRSALPNHWRHLCILSALGIIAFNWVLYAGLQHTSAAIGGLVFGVTPALILLVTCVWGGRRARLFETAGVVIAFSGVGLVLVGPALALNTGGHVGPFTVLASAAIWALYTVAIKRFAVPLPALVTLAVTVWIGVIALTPLMLWRGGLERMEALSWPLVGSAAYLGLGASVVAFWSWQRGVRLIGAARAGAFLQFIPLFGLILSALALGEQITGLKLFGLGFILSGVALTQFGSRWRKGLTPRRGTAARPTSVQDRVTVP